MNPSSLWIFPALLLCVSSTACRLHGERSTEKAVEDRVLPLGEFRRLFRADQLNARVCWYFGNRAEYSYVEIDDPRPIDSHDDMFNRRTHHTLHRFRVSEHDVTFTPAMAFAGYENGKRIVSPAFAGDHCTTFQVHAGATHTWRAAVTNGDKPGIGIELTQEAEKLTGRMFLLDPNRPKDFSVGSARPMEIHRCTGKEIRFAVQWKSDVRDELVLRLDSPLQGGNVRGVLESADRSDVPRIYEFERTK